MAKMWNSPHSLTYLIDQSHYKVDRLKGRQEDKPCCSGKSHYWAARGDHSGNKTNCIVTVADLLNWVSPKEKKSKLQKPRTKKKLRKRISKVIFPDVVLLNRSVHQKCGSSAFSVLTPPFCFLCCFPSFLFYSQEYNIMLHRHTYSSMDLYF